MFRFKRMNLTKKENLRLPTNISKRIKGLPSIALKKLHVELH